MLSPSSQLLLRLKIQPVLLPTDILVLPCPFAFLICGEMFVAFPCLNWFLPSTKFLLSDNYNLKISSCILFVVVFSYDIDFVEVGFLSLFFGFIFFLVVVVVAMSMIWTVNGQILNQERKFHLQFMPSQKSNICSLKLPYNFSGSQKKKKILIQVLVESIMWGIAWGKRKDPEIAE